MDACQGLEIGSELRVHYVASKGTSIDYRRQGDVTNAVRASYDALVGERSADDEAKLRAANSPGAPVREGEIVAGKYRVEGILGAGGMGVVVAARHLQLKQPVAIKFLLSATLSGADGIARFLREAESAARIQSEHVARVLDMATLDDGTPYMVMEFLAGRDLAQLLDERGPLPLEEAVGYVLQASEGIASAHAAGIVHRDLKPSNFFLAEGAGRSIVKVLDFGLSKVRASSPAEDAKLTHSAAILGSPLYMSPEQMTSAKDVDERTDIWSLGASLFQLVTGQAPFPGESITEVVSKVLYKEPPSASMLRADLPPAFAEALARSLEKDRDRRYGSVAEFAAALAPFGPPHSDLALERIAQLLGSRKRVPLELQATQHQPVQAASGRTRERSRGADVGVRTTGKAVWSQGEPVSARPRPRRGPMAAVVAIASAAAIGGVISAPKMAHWWAKAPARGELDIPVVSARPDVEEEFARGIRAYLGADIDGAERAFKQVEADEPKQVWPKLGLALTYAIERRFDESSASEAAALELARTERDVSARDRELLELLDAFDTPGFAARYDRYLADNPHYFLAQQTIAYYGMDADAAPARIHRFDVAIAIDDRHPVTYLFESWLHQRLGDFAAAKACLEQGLRRRSTAPWLLDQRGVLRLAEGDAEGAKSDFERATVDGPRQALVHYALALLRTGKATDEVLRKRQVETILALPSADLRIELGGQHVMALFARGRTADADQLLADLLQGSGVQAKTGTVMRSLLSPLWVDDALGRYDDAQKLLLRLETLLRKPGMVPEDLRQAQWMLTALQGIVDAETGKLSDAHEELRSLSEVTTTETLHRVLAAELTARIQLREGAAVSEEPYGQSLAIRARSAHLAGRAAERDRDDAAAERSYRVLLGMEPECANSDMAVVLTCAPYVASGLARLARLEKRQGRQGEVAQTLRAFDVMWPSPDHNLEPVRMAAEARASERQ
jgi:serine/threonine protein kinase/tetratricopeptide (TPR) repeat protein